MDKRQRIEAKFGQLVDIMERLRGEKGCPWDREQSYESLRQYLLEETYEVLELIDNKRYAELRTELGDLLLQVIFQSQIAKEDGYFDIEDVLSAINKKLIDRHPNVFGNTKINSAKEQTINWERMKKKEGKRSVVDGVPRMLSALLRASTSSRCFWSSASWAFASLTRLSISSVDRFVEAVIFTDCSLPVALSFAATFRMPLASISNVTSI